MRVPCRVVVAISGMLLAVFAGGCAAGGGGASRATTMPAGGSAVRPPFGYTPLRVRNSCFVESVHFYDLYRGMARNGAASWARVMTWGNNEDYNVKSGHAVAVWTLGDAVWAYDVNYGFAPLTTPAAKASDIHDVSPEVFAKYRGSKPVLARYLDDYFQRRPGTAPEFLFYHKNAEVREATKVASELGRYRTVRVIEFEAPEGDKTRTGAAAVFVFGNRLCTYFPSRGTHIAPLMVTSPDDLKLATEVVRAVEPKAVNVRWQAGGYRFYPPKP